MPLDVVNRGNPGTLGQSEIIDEYGITHAHSVEGVSAQRRHFYARFGGIDSKGRVQHGRSPAVASYLYRHLGLFLEGLLCFLDYRILMGIFTLITLNLRALHLISSHLIIEFVKNVIIACGTRQFHCSVSRFKDLCRFTRLTMRLLLPPEFARGGSAFLLTGLVRGT